MLFRSVAKCSAYGTNAMHCTSKHRRCDTTTALVREIPETLFVPAYAEDDNFIPERRKAGERTHDLFGLFQRCRRFPQGL